MSARTENVLRHGARLAFLSGVALGLLVTGCAATTPANGADRQAAADAPQTASPSPTNEHPPAAATSDAPRVVATAYRPADDSEPKPPEKPTPQPEAKPAEGELDEADVKGLGKDMSPEDEAKLKKYILKQIAEEAKKDKAEEAKQQPAKQEADAKPQTTARRPEPARKPAVRRAQAAQRQTPQRDQQAKKDSGGCSKGSQAGPLTPPPPDQPQPKLVCEQMRIERSDVWKGEMADFTFKIANAGNGPLKIQIKGG